MDSPYREELLLAFSAIQSAARLSQSLISSSDKGVISKSDLSPVTVADFAIQAVLVCTFRSAYPDDTFVGEENADDLRADPALLDRVWELVNEFGRPGGREALDGVKVPSSKEHLCELIDLCGESSPKKGRTWVFDPIDGTKAFMKGALYAINVGLLVDGRQAMGAIGCPNFNVNAKAPFRDSDPEVTGEGCICFVVKGHGAYVRPLNNPQDGEVHPQRLMDQPETVTEEDTHFVSCISEADSSLPGVHPLVAAKLTQNPYPTVDAIAWVIRWTSLAMGLANTAVWVYKSRTRFAKIWDHAGAMLLYEETGGKVTDCRGQEVDFMAGRKMEANFGFVAAPKGVHGKVLEAVRQTLEEQGKGDLLR